MLTTRKKAELIAELHGHRSEMTCKTLFALAEILIQEAREDNDRANRINVLRNQGAIAVLQEIRQHIERGLPGQQQKT